MQTGITFTNAQDIKDYITQQHINYIKIGIFDLNAVLRGKTISKNKFLSLLENGGTFYDGVLAGDIDDQLIDNMQFSGAHTGYPDANIAVIPESGRLIPWENDQLFFLSEYVDRADALCPRQLLKRIMQQANNMGYTVYSAMEYEFTVLDETSESIRQKDTREFKPFTAGNFGYSLQRSSVHDALYQDLLQNCRGVNLPLECIHTEIGPGMLEVALSATTGLTAADNASLFKAFCKTLVERHQLTATFMAKWREDVQGHGAHVHLSLLNEEKQNVFYDKNDQHGMSQLMKHFVAGQQALMPEFLALCAPTINSYARYIPGCWAPTEANWGFENRAVSLRVIKGGTKGQRIEYRIAGADCNPYLAYAAALASGLYGIEHKLSLPPACDLTDPQRQRYPLPSSLQQATQLFQQSTAAKTAFGELFVQDYAATRDWEVRQHQKAVTDWQLRRYLDTV